MFGVVQVELGELAGFLNVEEGCAGQLGFRQDSEDAFNAVCIVAEDEQELSCVGNAFGVYAGEAVEFCVLANAEAFLGGGNVPRGDFLWAGRAEGGGSKGQRARCDNQYGFLHCMRSIK